MFLLAGLAVRVCHCAAPSSLVRTVRAPNIDGRQDDFASGILMELDILSVNGYTIFRAIRRYLPLLDSIVMAYSNLMCM